jgi:NAD-dependent dihydropyrimidine dehydrogenase PreA subunit/flavodoxin
MGIQSSSHKLHIIYFSGSYGTKYASECLFSSFKNKGADIKISEIFQADTIETDTDNVLIIMYPVHAGDAPHSVYKWISSLKRIQNKKAVIISVSGGGEISPNTACRFRVKGKLIKKGYTITNEYMLCMPSNVFISTEENLSLALFKVLPAKCELIASEIINDKERIKKPLFFDIILTYLFLIEKTGVKALGRYHKVNKDCTGCKLCSKKCPTGNIIMKNDKPHFKWNCSLCTRCFYICPVNSISVRILKFFKLKNGLDIYSLASKADETDIPEISSQKISFIWNGVLKYINDIENI